MGTSSKTTCIDCGHTFMDSSGGGRSFDQFRCENCGESIFVSHKELGEVYDTYGEIIFQKFLKELEGDYKEDDNKDYEKDYESGAQEIIGKCTCGGRYLLNAPSRCPNCHSTHLETDDSDIIYYD